MCAQGRGRPPHGPAASPDSTESPRYSGRPSPALLPIPDSFSQLRLEARRSMLPLPQASPRALSAKRRQHRINPSRDKRFILEREEIAQALPERTRAAPDATGASPAGCREGACGVASPRWARWAESWAGHPAPEMRELARGRLCGRLGGAFCTGHGGGVRILLHCEGPGPGQDQFCLLCWGAGWVALTKSETGVGHPPLPHLPGTAPRARGAR